jgi:hypothetical protein
MPGRSKLEERFERWVTEPGLQPLLRIIQALMRFRPEDRISAEEALKLLDSSSRQVRSSSQKDGLDSKDFLNKRPQILG